MPAASTPRGLRVLPGGSKKSTSIKAEKDALNREIAQIGEWWQSSRWKGTTRTFSGEYSWSV